MKKVISVMTIATILCTTVMPLYAKSISELQQEQQQLNQEAKKTEDALYNTKAEKDTVFFEITKLDGNIEVVENELENLDIQLNETQNRLEDSENALVEAQLDKENQYESTKKRIKYIYENGNIGYLDVLLNFSDFSDLLTRIENINNIITYDNNVIEKMKLTEQTIQTKIVEIETDKKTIELLAEEQQNKKHSLEQSKIQKGQQMAKLEADVEAYERKLKEIEEDDAEIKAYIKKAEEEARKKAEEEARRKAEEEARRKAEEARRKAEEDRKKAEAANKNTTATNQASAKPNTSSSSQSTTTSYKGGKLMWPLPGYSVGSGASGFGSRISPITGKKEVHRGLDIPAPRGTKVLAAEGGTVITAKYLNSYGYAVIIDHGNGISTVYGHNSKLLVSAGDTVKRGQAISQVGSTGDSTGNHLHFEVRKNGDYVNPIPYLN